MKKEINYPQELFNLNLEYSFLNYLIDVPVYVNSVINIVSSYHFFTASCALVFDELVNAYENKVKLSRVVIESKLKQKKLESNWIYEKNSVTTPEELKSIAIEIVQYSKKRGFYELTELASKGLVSGTNVESVINSFSSSLLKLNKVDKSAEVEEVFKQLEVEMKSIREGKKLKTGFEMMDLLLPPFIGGHIWVIGAYTGSGKTFFALQLAKNVAEQEGNVAIFSTELQSYENLGRIVGNQFEKGYQSMWQPGGDSWLSDQKVKDYAKQINPFLRIYDNKRTIQEISMECRALVFRNKLDVVVIDFIQNIDIGEKDSYEGMKKVSLEIQRLAKELKIAIIVTSQVANSVAKNGSKGVIEYKGAGEIAASADVGILLHDETEKYKNEMIRPQYRKPDGYKPILCDIKKARHMGNSKIPFFITFPSGKVIEAPEKWDWHSKARRDEYWEAKAEQWEEDGIKPEKYPDDNSDLVENTLGLVD